MPERPSVGPSAWLDRPCRPRDALWHFPAEAADFRISELRRRSRGIAAALSERGVMAGDRVAIMLDNRSTLVCLLLAIWRLGAIAVPLRPVGGAGNWLECYLAEIDRTCDLRLVVTEDSDLADPVAQAATCRKPLVSVGTLKSVLEPPKRYCASAQELALIQFSSGSTGRPKGVMVTHHMIGEQVRQLASNYARAGNGALPTSIACWLPFYHDMGLFIGVLLPLYLDADVMAAPPAFYMRNPARWFRAMSDRRDDLTFSTNSALGATLRWLRRLEPGGCDLSALVMYIAAEKISPRVLDELSAVLGPHGLAADHIRAGYGMAEYALGCTSTQNLQINRATVTIDPAGRVHVGASPQSITLASTGVPNESCTIAIRDEVGHVLGEQRIGEITVSGPCLSPGYYNDQAATLLAMENLWLRTGDIGFLLDGELYFCARKDEMLVVGGRNIAPSDVELAVEQLDFVGPGRSVIFAVEDSCTSTPLQVLLVEAPDLPQEVLSERLAALRRRVLEQFGFVPTVVELVPKGTVEKTSSGKKRTAVIRNRYLSLMA
jgi:fatty-acyl-CoA synthase